ncbi:hypothetical protein CERSUDRAFT_59668, partial [Gelatoporia subvermispora B]
KPWTLPTPTPKVDPDGFEDPICDRFWKDVWLACAVHNIYRKVFHAIPDDPVTTWKQYKEFITHHERLNKPPKGKDRATDYTNTDTHGSSTPTPPTPPATDEKGRTKNTKGVEPFDQTEREEMERLLGEIKGHLVLYPSRFLEGEDMANNFLFNADRSVLCSVGRVHLTYDDSQTDAVTNLRLIRSLSTYCVHRDLGHLDICISIIVALRCLSWISTRRINANGDTDVVV